MRRIPRGGPDHGDQAGAETGPKPGNLSANRAAPSPGAAIKDALKPTGRGEGRRIRSMATFYGDLANRAGAPVPTRQPIGRSGMPEHNKQDHAITTAMLCAKSVTGVRSTGGRPPKMRIVGCGERAGGMDANRRAPLRTDSARRCLPGGLGTVLSRADACRPE